MVEGSASQLGQSIAPAERLRGPAANDPAIGLQRVARAETAIVPNLDGFLEKLRSLKPSDLVLERVSSRTALAALEPQWQELADHSVENNPFYEPWMVLPALEHLEARRVDVALLWAAHPSGRKGERLLCGVFPLVEHESSRSSPVPVLSLWKYEYCYLCAPLVRTTVARATVTAFFDAIARGEFGRAIFRFDDLPGDGLLRQLIVDELYFRRWPNQLGNAYTRAYFRPAADAATFLAQALPGKRRKELRRQQTRLSETLGEVRFTELTDPADAPAWAEKFAALEAQGWKGREAVAVHAREGEGHLAFFRALVRQAALRDRLMMIAMEAGPHTVAMKLNLVGGGGGFAFKITYDEAYAKYSPGVLLELENIQQLHARTDVKWMDSCASPNRFMINHLWPERRELQTLFFTPDVFLNALVLSLLPLQRLAKRLIARWRGVGPELETDSEGGSTTHDRSAGGV